MKLADIKGEKSMDVLAELIGPLANIAMDKKAASVFNHEKAPEGEDPKNHFMKDIQKGMPVLLRDHKEDFIVIACAISGKTKEEYLESMKVSSLMKDILDLATDPDFIRLF